MQSLFQSDIFSHIPDMKYMPRWAVLLFDLFLCFGAYVISFAIGSSLFTYGLEELALGFWQQMFIVMLIQVFCFWIFHSYSGIIRFSTFVDIIKVLLAVFSCGVMVLLINVIVQQTADIKLFLNTLPFIYCPLAFIILFCIRVGVKTLYDAVLQHTGQRRRVLIYGTKSAGLAIAKMLRSSGSSYEYVPKGFITDGKDIRSYSIQGLPIYVKNDELIPFMHRKNIRDIIVSPLKMKEINPATDLDIFLKNDIRILTVPSFTSWSQGDETKVRMGRIESIQIEDLLERPTINMNTENVSAILSGQVVMITGAAGSIGSELVRQVLHFSPSVVVLFEQAESPLHDLHLDLRHQYPDANIVAYIGDWTFYDCISLDSVVIPDSVTRVGDKAFRDCRLLKSIELPASVNSIGRGAFYGCSSLQAISIPIGVSSIEEETFACCSDLKSVLLPDGVTSIGERAFLRCLSLTSIALPDSIAHIGFQAFLFSSLESVVIPKNVTDLGRFVFDGCSSLERIDVDGENLHFCSIDGALFTKDGKTLVRYPEGRKSGRYAVPDGATSIGEYAFNGCSHLTSVDIPNCIVEIGRGAFCECSSLKSIVIPLGVEKIESSTFYECSSLQSIVIPDNVTEIGECAFRNCSSLTSLVIPNGVTQIAFQLFADCSSLDSIIVPSSVKEIREEAFLDCSSLKSIVITNDATEIGDGAFKGCKALTIRARKGSSAEKYARKRRIKFEPLD